MQGNDTTADLFGDAILPGKVCTKCKTFKPIEQYTMRRDRGKPAKRHTWCRECKSKNTAQWYAKGNNKDRSRATRYKIPRHELAEMRMRQNGKCACCGGTEMPINPRTGKKYDLAIDHDHETGIVRELLCPNCNNGLGCFKDSVEKLQLAISYLQRHGR